MVLLEVRQVLSLVVAIPPAGTCLSMLATVMEHSRLEAMGT
jgi:hypothetical protein